jgi:toxin ParE1/3/4
MSVRRLEFSADAEADLQAIAHFTEESWGREQAGQYLADLWAAFERIQMFPHSGKEQPDIAAGMRSAVAEKHVVLYRASDKAIRVMRIVHGRSSVGKHLVADEDEQQAE